MSAEKRILLACPKGEMRRVCEKMSKLPRTWSPYTQPPSRPTNHKFFMVVCPLGDRHSWVVSAGNRAEEILVGDSRLLH